MATEERKVMELALEALEMYCEHGAILKPIETRDAIKEALAQPEQKPVAWKLESGQAIWFERTDPEAASALPPDVTMTPLYTAPPQRKPLTDEQIKAVIARIDPDEQYMPKALRQFSRAIEAAHGIKE